MMGSSSSSLRQVVVALILAATMSQAACANDLAPPVPQKPFAQVHGDLLTLRRDMLGKSWLLSPTLILASPTPQVMPMRPKVVTFELHDNTVALVEPHAPAVYDTLPNNRLLDTFPLRAANAESVTFAWGQGLHVVPLTSPTVASDIPGSLEEGLDGSDPALPVVASFVKEARLDGDSLELVQVSRLRMPKDDHSAELHVRFDPYVPNSQFTALPSAIADGVGFFEVANLAPKSGTIVPQAARWDVSRPIDYAIAADTPDEVRQAIAEGILYWNRVAGRTIVKISNAPAGQVVAKPHQVLVHWVPWTDAGFASSALQPDPVTGEILFGDIFLTSFWVDAVKNFVGGKLLASLDAPAVGTSKVVKDFVGEKVLASLDAAAAETPKNASPTALVPGFASARVCAFGDASLAKRWRAEMAALPDPLMPMALDHLRAVVAHETGHTLGLRHNFAASLGSELRTPEAQQAAWEKYLAGRGGARTSDSVMDYTTMTDTMLQGVALLREAFPYDAMAIQWGYGDEAARSRALATAKEGVFCTDMEARVGVVLGCQLDDAGPDPILFYQAALADQGRMVTAMLSAWLQAGGSTPKKSFEEVAAKLNPGAVLLRQLRPAMEAFKQLQQGSQVIWVDRALGGQNWLNSKTYKEATLQAQREALDKVGGVPGLLAAAVRRDAAGGIEAGWLQTLAFERVGVLQSIFLQPGDAATLRAAIPPVAEQLEDLYLMALFASLSGGLTAEDGMKADKGYAEGLADPAWEGPLHAMAASVILGENGETSGTVDGTRITVGTPRYSLRTRGVATRMYSAAVFARPDWMKQQRQRLVDELKARAAKVAGERKPTGLEALMPGFVSMPSLAGRDASPELRQWVEETALILRALDEAGGD